MYPFPNSAQPVSSGGFDNVSSILGAALVCLILLNPGESTFP